MQKNTCLASLLGMVFMMHASIVMAENPWQQRYDQRGSAAPVIAGGGNSGHGNAAPSITASPSHYGDHEITYEDVEKMVSDALISEGAGETIRVILEPKKPGPLMSHTDPIEAHLEEISYNAKESTWAATLYLSTGGRPLAPWKIKGRYDEMVEVPVLKRRKRHQETITESDIELKPVSLARLKENTIMDASALIGKAPHRTISPGRAIRRDEIATPAVILKGDRVTMLFKNERMEIKAQGEALEEGAEGSTIRVRNTDSNTIIRTVVVGPGLVTATTMTNK